VQALAYSPDGQTLAGNGNDLRIWSMPDGATLQIYTQETYFARQYTNGLLTYSPDGKFIYYGRNDGTVCSALNPYRQDVQPNHGGNTGNVTIKIIMPDTFLVPDGATVTLRDGVRPDISMNATSVNNHVLTGTFALNGAPLGMRDVIITTPDNRTQTYPQGF